MTLHRLLTAAAAVSLLVGLSAPAAFAQDTTTAPAAPAAPAASAKPVVASGDLIQTIKASGQFTTFLKAADATNLTAVLAKSPNLTLFAPTDAAFAALPPGKLTALMADTTSLQKLLTHHIINARVDSAKIKGAKGPVPSVAGDPIELDGSGDTLKADNATIVQPDVMASNGILHVVNQVMIAGSVPAVAGDAGAPASATVAEPAAPKK
jgi:uncharacterized surface protein with fasciclin (FAS1) repeats